MTALPTLSGLGVRSAMARTTGGVGAGARARALDLRALGAHAQALGLGALVFAGFRCIPHSQPPPPPPVATRVGPCSQTLDATTEPDPQVVVATQCIYYEVVGESAPSLREFMNASGPADATGTYDAYTGFDLHYRYHDTPTAAGCAVGPVTVELRLTHTLPEWRPPAGISAELVARWDHFIERLRVHEAGHADIAVRAANELSWSLRTLPVVPTCADLRDAVHTIFVRVVDRSRDAHMRYDWRTHHGATQGSAFP